MPVMFKYKNPVNISYAPGRANIGEDGEIGNPGKAGNALYFTNLELDNSYNIELTLQKIENNVVLSSSSTGSIKNIREYKIDDLILSSSGKCYKIIQSTSESLFKNYKYDIEYLGAFRSNTSANALRVTFKKLQSDNKNNPVPNNSSLVKDSPSDSDYKLRTLSYEVKLFGTEYSPDKFYSGLPGEETPEDEKEKWEKAIASINSGEDIPYRYSIQIRLKNTKQFCFQSSPEAIEKSASDMNLSFYKTLDIPNVDLFKDSFYIDPDKQSFNDGLAKYCKTSVFTVSDSMLDRLHPSKNNVSCTLNNNKDMWYKTGIRSDDNGLNEESYKITDLVKDEFVETSEKYGTSTVYIEPKNRKFVENGKIEEVDYDNLVTAFPKYSAAPKEETDDISISLSESAKGNLNNIVEQELVDSDSKLLIKDRNILPGTSLYFSSILDDELCRKEMENFLFSQNTTTYVIAKNLKTKEIVISEVPFEIE